MPRDDRDYVKTEGPPDVKPFVRKVGNNMLHALMGGSNYLWPRTPEAVAAHEQVHMKSADKISRAVRPDLEDDEVQ